MEFKIIDITSASKIKVKSATITTVIIPTNEVLSLDEDEVGILEGRFSHHWKGAYFQGGIINPGWSGKITAELMQELQKRVFLNPTKITRNIYNNLTINLINS